MKKKIFFGFVALLALPFAIPPFRQGFVEGAREQWRHDFPNGFRQHVKNQQNK